MYPIKYENNSHESAKLNASELLFNFQSDTMVEELEARVESGEYGKSDKKEPSKAAQKVTQGVAAQNKEIKKENAQRSRSNERAKAHNAAARSAPRSKSVPKTVVKQTL